MATNKKVSVTLVRSPIGRQPAHRATVVGLGLKRLHQTVILDDTPSIRGMLNKVYYMLAIETVNQ